MGFGVAFDGVFIEQDGDESGGRNGHKGANDTGEGGSDKEGDKDGDAHEVDGGLHDAGGEDGVFDVDVDGVEDEDAGHFGPGIERGDAAGEDDGDDAASDGNDVEQAHKDAEKDEVADVQETKDDRAADSQDEHQQTLAEEPFAHFEFGFLHGEIEAGARSGGDEGEKVGVHLTTFEHEVDGEKDGGEDVEEMGEPVGKGAEEIAGGGSEGILGAGGGFIEADVVGEREAFGAGDEGRDAGGRICDEGAEIADNGRKGDREEEEQREGEDGDEKEDSDAAARGPVADAHGLETPDDGHEDDGEEGADVENLKLFHQVPSERENKKYREEEEDVAVDLLDALGRFDGGQGGFGCYGRGIHQVVGCKQGCESG